MLAQLDELVAQPGLLAQLKQIAVAAFRRLQLQDDIFHDPGVRYLIINAL